MKKKINDKEKLESQLKETMNVIEKIKPEFE